MPELKWNKNYIWKGYELALAGLSNKEIALSLKISYNTFAAWRLSNPSFANGIKYARKRRKRETQVNLEEFIYGRLPPDLKEYWNHLQIELDEERESGGTNITVESQQMLFLHAWYKSDFNVSDACRKIGTPRTKYNYWRKNYPEFSRLCQEMELVRKDFVEGMVMRLIREGNAAAAVRTNQALNRDRGYSEKIDLSIDARLSESEGVDIESLDLSLECRKELLEKIREKELEEERRMDAEGGSSTL